MQRKREEIEEATMLRDEVPPVKEAIHRADSHDEGGGHGGSEMGWLVSYADMMTLLFGLFAILFSLSQDKTRPVEETMPAVSDKFFRDSKPTDNPVKDGEKTPDKSPTPPAAELQKNVSEMKAAMAAQQAELEKTLEALKTETDHAQAERKQLEDAKTATEAAAAAEKQVSEAEKLALQSEKQDLESKLAEAQAESKLAKIPAPKKADPSAKLKAELETLKKKLAATTTDQKDIEKQKTTVEAEKKAVETQKKSLEALKASADSQKQALEAQKETLKAAKLALETQKQALESEKKTLERKIASVEDKAKKVEPPKPDLTPQLQAEIETLKKEMAAAKAQNEKLQKDAAASASSGSQKAPQSYMMVLLSWETEKHDLDLQVVDPRKKSFNFKKRQNKNEPGQFELDSRFGPGIEMWKAENFVTGQYRAQISMYAQNGNEAPARARLTVITNLKTYISEPIEIARKGEAHDVGFDVQADGSVTFKGTSP